MRQTKEDKAAYSRGWLDERIEAKRKEFADRVQQEIDEYFSETHDLIMGIKKPAGFRPLADITISEDNSVTITPVSEKDTSHETN